MSSASLAGATPPPPNSIPLPPGVTLDQFESLQGSLVTLAIVTAVSFGILLWDYFNLLPDEINLYRSSNKGLWGTPATWSFVILRYSGIVATLPSLFFTSIQSNHCQAAVVLSQVGVFLVVASSGIIFCYRVVAIWGGHKAIYGAVGFMYIAMLGCWGAVATQYRAKNGSHTPFGSNCQIEPIPTWSPISFSSSVAFDAVILLLTISKLNTNRATSSKVGYLIYRDSLMYFILTAGTNTTLLIIQALGPVSNLVKATSMPFSTLITATMGARVFLNLKLFNQRQARADQGLPFASTMSNNGKGDHTSTKPPQIPNITVRPPLPKPIYPSHLTPVVSRPDTPFASYDYDSPKEDTTFEMAHFTRETVVVLE